MTRPDTTTLSAKQNREINYRWQFLFRHVPGALLIFSILVFLYLESTASRFCVTGNGIKARHQSAERSRAYIRDIAPDKLFLEEFFYLYSA